MYFILWRRDPLLSDDSVTATVSGQQLGKHVPVASNKHGTKSVARQLSSAWEAVKLEPECA